VYAETNDHQIYRLEAGGQWRKVVRDAAAPVYPG
jgi:hypothetical protein